MTGQYREGMRVVSGSARGRPLRAEVPATIRPTTDRVKESMFDILGSLGGVVDLDVLDVFCGSGALGIEALSRGANSVTFVDADPRALECAKQNLLAVGLDLDAARFVRATLPGWVAPQVDLVFADPPYGEVDAALVLAGISADLVVFESRDELGAIEGWRPLRERRYGTTLVTVLTRPDDEDVAE